MRGRSEQEMSNNKSRRDFLKHSAGTIAASAAAASLLRAPAAYAAADDTIKVALIGCGGRGTGAAVNALATAGAIKLITVADAFEDNARNTISNLKNTEVADKVDVAPDKIFWGFDAYQKAIDAGPDVVILTAPPGFRPQHFEACVKAGKHVFMEKPVAVDAPGVRKILEAAKLAKEKNLKVGVGLQRHHDSKYQDTIKRVHDGALGDLVLLRVYWNDAGVWVRARKEGMSEMEYQMRNWYYFNWLSGDHIVEQHIHNLDIANWVKNATPVTAVGMGGRQVLTGMDHGEIFDHHAVEFTYADGTKMMSQCRHQPGCWSHVAEYAHGTKGTAEFHAGVIKPTGAEAWRYGGPKVNPYQVEHDVLMDAIRNNKPFNEADYGALSTMTAIMGRMATYSGVEIFWDKATAAKLGKTDPKTPTALDSNVTLLPERYAWDAQPPSVRNSTGGYNIPAPGSGAQV
jgi:myo-inositol 2-dehydrogenase / D-chiro-inositol 1-dehydrogenase